MDMTQFAVSAIGTDRPGIVAAISKVLLDLDGNVEDSQMTILRGHFAVMLIVSLPEEADVAQLRDGLAEAGSELDLEAIAVSPVAQAPSPGPGASHVLTVYGADHPGIVHAVSSALAERGISITGLETRIAGTGDTPIYVMLMEIAAAGTDLDELRGALEGLGSREELDVSLRELEAEAL